MHRHRDPERDPTNPLTDSDGEMRELGNLDSARAKRVSDLPGGLQGKLRRGRGRRPPRS